MDSNRSSPTPATLAATPTASRSGATAATQRNRSTRATARRASSRATTRNGKKRTTYKSGSTATYNLSQLSPRLPTGLPRSLPVTTLSATSWRPAYPQIGQFAMTVSEEVVAASPSGLIYFRRVRDHDSEPWTEPRPLPNTPAMLNDTSVSGLAVCLSTEYLSVYCVSDGVLHSFYRSKKRGSSFVVNLRPPLSTYLVTGTPAVTLVEGKLKGKDADEDEDGDEDYQFDKERWSLVVPCQSGGLLHTSTTGPCSSSHDVSKQDEWAPVDHVAADLGVISAVSIAAVHTREYEWDEGFDIDIVAVCIASARLHTVEGRFEASEKKPRHLKWKAQTSTRIHHPGEVTGNPVLVKRRTDQLDLLVPSTERGVFHFIRTTSTPDEWHMIARITFPEGIPTVSCLGFTCIRGRSPKPRRFRALVQSRGRLYNLRSHKGSNPWSRSSLKQIVVPGPFSD